MGSQCTVLQLVVVCILNLKLMKIKYICVFVQCFTSINVLLIVLYVPVILCDVCQEEIRLR